MIDTVPTIVLLCAADHLTRERKGLYESLTDGADVVCIRRYYDSIDGILDSLGDQTPDLLIHPDPPRRYLPRGLERSPIPTACLHIDTYSESENRARTSLLFDLALVCHPGYPEYFRKNGHPEPLLFPHAVRGQHYAGALPPKTNDVAMVGRMDGKRYTYRRACIRAVERIDVQINDYGKYYDYSEMSSLYKRSKIGVNISRDDHLSDANLRCFEVMAGGALLLTPSPTELTELGLKEKTHFVTFQSEDDLCSKVEYYLRHEKKRREIGARARRAVLAQFSYERWAERLTKRIDEGIPKQAPARNMSEGEAAGIYVDYYSKRGMIDDALFHLRRQRVKGGGTLPRSIANTAVATLRGWWRSLGA